MKYLTFSFDDGVEQDKRLIGIFDKYSLKATFNLNSELLGKSGQLVYPNCTVAHNKVNPEEVKSLYKNHEVAAHTLTHPNLTGLSDEEVIRQVEQDRLNLSELAGYNVVGMAYPCGGVNNNEHTASLIKQNTGIKYARTISDTFSLDVPQNPYRFDPTLRHRCDREKMAEMIEKFVSFKGSETKLFYIWGHSYECDMDDSWEYFESVCCALSGLSDVFYGTNTEVFKEIYGI